MDFQALPALPSVWSLVLAHGKLEWLLTTATHGSFRKRGTVHHGIGGYRLLYLCLRPGFLFPDVLSNRIELDATEPADNPVLETLQNINPISHVVQAVYSIPRKSTLGVSLGNALRCRVESPLQDHDPLRSEYRTLLPSQVEAEVAVVSTERLLLVSRKDRQPGRRCV